MTLEQNKRREDIHGAPVLSICIPTYNRARLLEHALGRLNQQCAALKFPFEIFISDNASPDDTAAVIARFSEDLPIRSYRQKETIPAYANYAFAMSNGAGEYLTYLADDDELILDSLGQAVSDMAVRPDIGFVCGSWFVGAPDEPVGEGFFRVERDHLWPRGAYAQALADILRWRIWPEIMIWRTDVFRRLQPRDRKHAYWAFANIADVLRLASIQVRKLPFYRRLVRKDEAPSAPTAGTIETMEAWDRYRGGLEYLLGAAHHQINEEQRKALIGAMTPFIGERMAAAVRIRLARGVEPVETYDLAMRARGLGFDHLIAPMMRQIATRAALHFLVYDERLNFEIESLACIGKTPPEFQASLQRIARKPVVFSEDGAGLQLNKSSLVLVTNKADRNSPDIKRVCAMARCVIFETDLVAKFAPQV